MPSISILEFIGNQFVLKNDKGEIIYNLDQYRKDISKVKLIYNFGGWLKNERRVY